MKSIVVTFVSPDRPGLVDKVSDIITQNDGSWQESRLAHLAGQFAGIVRIEVADSKLGQLTTALKELTDHELQLTIVKGTDAAAADASLTSAITLQVVGNDRPGIIQRISAVLGSHDVNVEELTSECRDAPHSGGSIFTATAQIRLPEGMSVELLQDELERIASDLMIDVTFN